MASNKPRTFTRDHVNKAVQLENPIGEEQFVLGLWFTMERYIPQRLFRDASQVRHLEVNTVQFSDDGNVYVQFSVKASVSRKDLFEWFGEPDEDSDIVF
jgi:hypothetical protein